MINLGITIIGDKTISEVQYYVELITFLSVLVALLIASYQDLKERLVDGYVWLVLLILIIPVSIIRLIIYWDEPNVLGLMVISIVIGLIISIIMLVFGLWGGADSLALVCISFLSPISLQTMNGLPNIFSDQYLSSLLPMSLIIVMNAAVLQLPLPFIIFTKNIINSRSNPQAYELPKGSKLQKIFASFLGEPLPISVILAKPLFHYQALEKNNKYTNEIDLQEKYPVPFIRLTSEPLLRWKIFRSRSIKQLNSQYMKYEESKIIKSLQGNFNNEWAFDFSIGLKSEEEDLYRQRTVLNQATKGPLKRTYLWVQYSIPFLIPMLVGYILAFNGINIIVELLK